MPEKFEIQYITLQYGIGTIQYITRTVLYQPCFSAERPQILSLTLQAPYVLHLDDGDERESIPLDQSEHTSSYLRICKKKPSTMMAASKTEHLQLLGGVLDQGLKELGYSREDLNGEFFAGDRQHVLDLYCSKGQNCCYNFYGPSFGMAYEKPQVQ